MSKRIFFLGTTYTKNTLNDMTGPELVKLHNELAKLHDQPLTKRFSNKEAGIKRTWKLLEQTPNDRKPAPAKTTKVTKTSSAPKARRGTNLAAPGGAPVACREGSKQAILVDMLSRADGASMDQLLEALSGGNKPWTEATVRSGFGWDLKQKGYGVRSIIGDDGGEVFFLVVPEGFSIPPHRPLKGKPKADARQANMKV